MLAMFRFLNVPSLHSYICLAGEILSNCLRFVHTSVYNLYFDKNFNKQEKNKANQKTNKGLGDKGYW